jgi:hypothetical protein
MADQPEFQPQSARGLLIPFAQVEIFDNHRYYSLHHPQRSHGLADEK